MSYFPHSPLGLIGRVVETSTGGEPAPVRFGGAASSYGTKTSPPPVPKAPPKAPPKREKKRTVSLRDLEKEAEERGEVGPKHEAHEKGEFGLITRQGGQDQAAIAELEAAERRKKYVLYGAVAVGGLAALWIVRKRKATTP